MYDQLYTYITAKNSISAEEFELIKEAFSPQRLRKKQYFLQEGQVARHTAFVTKGILRQYLVDDKGSEHITQFALEDWWIGDRESLATGAPSAYNIDALEDSELLVIQQNDLVELEQKVPAFKSLIDQIKEKRAFSTQKRVVSALSYTAEQKYQQFIDTYPQIIQRVPLHMIASYLGITPETLSRLRAKAARK